MVLQTDTTRPVDRVRDVVRGHGVLFVASELHPEPTGHNYHAIYLGLYGRTVVLGLDIPIVHWAHV